MARQIGGLDGADWDTPDRQVARAEALHPDDGDDWDADLGPDDMGEFVDVAGIKDIPRDALKVLLRFIIPAKSVSNRKRFRVAQLRLVTLARLIGVDDLAEQSLDSIGKDLGATRALLSLYQVRMVDSLHINKPLTGKQRRSRESYKQAAIRSHIERGHRMKSQDPAHRVSA